MLSRGGTKRRAAAAVAITGLVASGCGAGRNAQTVEQRPTIDGTNATLGHLGLRGLAIMAPNNPPFYYAAGSAAPLKLVIVNNGERPDSLTAITSSAVGSWASFATAAQASAAAPAAAPASRTASAAVSASASPGAAVSSNPLANGTSAVPAPTGQQSVQIQPNERVSYGVPDSQKALMLLRLRTRLYPGNAVPITFTFARAGKVTVQVPIMLTTAPPSSIVPGPNVSGEIK